MIALACLAVRRLRSPGEAGRPLLAGVLYATCFAIRQEMLIVLLPLAIAAGVSKRGSSRATRNAATLAAIVVAALLLLGLQRRAATGRFGLTTGHGALALFGTFMPGSSSAAWIDARAYAEALDPTLPRGPYGSSEQFLRLTRDEIRRRPAFHALRVASWLPRLALKTDADNLFWSVGSPRSVSPERQPAATRFAHAARPWLIAELAIVQGLFVAALWIGVRRRRWDILALAVSVGLKFMIHMIVSPVGRLIVPAIALELLTIPLAAPEWVGLGGAARARSLLLGATISAALILFTPPLTGLVERLDDGELVGVRDFVLDAGFECRIRCRLQRGTLVGLSPTTAWLRADEAGPPATLACTLPTFEPETVLRVVTDGAPGILADEVRVWPDGGEGSRFTIRNPNSVRTVVDRTSGRSRGRRSPRGGCSSDRDDGWSGVGRRHPTHSNLMGSLRQENILTD